MDILQEIPRLLERRVELDELIKFLEGIQGRNAEGKPKCIFITFKSHTNPTKAINAGHDYELINLLVRTALSYYTERLTASNLLLSLAAKGLEGVNMREELERLSTDGSGPDQA